MRSVNHTERWTCEGCEVTFGTGLKSYSVMGWKSRPKPGPDGKVEFFSVPAQLCTYCKNSHMRWQSSVRYRDAS